MSFELLGLALVTPFGAWLYGFEMFDMGTISVISSLIATCWNYLFNRGFDGALRQLRGHTGKTKRLRVLHAVLFEVGLLSILLPIFSWWLGLEWLESLLVQASFALFYTVYTFVFTWVYDRMFPDPGARPA